MTSQDLPSIKLIAEHRPLAAAPHTCNVCGLPIAIGSTYQRLTVRLNDALDRKRNLRTFKWHLPSCPSPKCEEVSHD
jgi:hypothetical protein